MNRRILTLVVALVPLTTSSAFEFQILEPSGYFDFLTLMKRSMFIMTDSGGIQEEATAPSIDKKVFVLRISTERPEAVESGHAVVVGTDPEKALQEMKSYAESGFEAPNGKCPFGIGEAAKKIVSFLLEE